MFEEGDKVICHTDDAYFRNVPEIGIVLADGGNNLGIPQSERGQHPGQVLVKMTNNRYFWVNKSHVRRI